VRISRGDQPPASWFRDRIAELPRGVNPVTSRLLDARQRGFLRGTVRRGTGKLRQFGDEHLILIAPVDNNLVFGHHLRGALARAESKANGTLAVRV
jgi:hypothetical protein